MASTQGGVDPTVLGLLPTNQTLHRYRLAQESDKILHAEETHDISEEESRDISGQATTHVSSQDTLSRDDDG